MAARTRKKLQQPDTLTTAVQELLASEGYRPQVEEQEEGPPRLRFKSEGTSYLVRFDPRDAEFLQLCCGFSVAEGLRDELALLRAANEVQGSTKVVKVFLFPDLDVVEFQMELVVGAEGFTTPLLDRCLGTLRAASAEYFEKAAPVPPAARA